MGARQAPYNCGHRAVPDLVTGAACIPRGPRERSLSPTASVCQTATAVEPLRVLVGKAQPSLAAPPRARTQAPGFASDSIVPIESSQRRDGESFPCQNLPQIGRGEAHESTKQNQIRWGGAVSFALAETDL